MIEQALRILRPGGRLVYATCSLEREENEAVVEGFPVLATHSRIPGRDPGDGFFAAVISSDVASTPSRVIHDKLFRPVVASHSHVSSS